MKIFSALSKLHDRIINAPKTSIEKKLEGFCTWLDTPLWARELHKTQNAPPTPNRDPALYRALKRHVFGYDAIDVLLNDDKN